MNTWHHQSIISLVKLLSSDVEQGLTDAEKFNSIAVQPQLYLLTSKELLLS